jgi:excisionase family DNA binding protein
VMLPCVELRSLCRDGYAMRSRISCESTASTDAYRGCRRCFCRGRPVAGTIRWRMTLALYTSCAEAARIAGVTPAYVRRMVATGQIRGEKIGGSWVVLREDVARFVRIGRGPARKPAAAKKTARRRRKK